MVADADNGKTVPVSNPATGQVFGTVPNMVAAETRRAVEAANVAWPAASPQKVPIGHFGLRRAPPRRRRVACVRIP